MSETSLLGFIAHLAQFEARLHHAQHAGLERAAVIVEAEAKRELGTYQDAAGPFAAWQELADATKDERTRKGFTENDPGLRSGVMRDGIDHRSDHQQAVVGSNDDEMVWFELGTQNQPPRSVLGSAIVHKEAEIVHILGASVATALVGHDVTGGQLQIKP